MARTKIEWATHTWSPITGCTKVSPGCAHCYAERMARRLAGRFGYPDMPHHFDVTLHPDKLEQPLRWKKPRMVFVCSMGDLFHPDVKDDWIARIWGVMMKAEQHTFLVLTKRPERMKEFVDWFYLYNHEFYPWPNIWLGVTIEAPEYSYRADYLRQTPAAVRFLSMEPLLASFADCPGVFDDMDWAIVGGESGPGARPMHPDRARGIRDQCRAAGVPFFFKQWGAWAWPGFAWSKTDWAHLDAHTINDAGPPRRIGKNAAGRLLDGREWNEMPPAARQEPGP